MEDVQFLDWSDLKPGEKEYIQSILFDSTNGINSHETAKSPQTVLHQQTPHYAGAAKVKEVSGDGVAEYGASQSTPHHVLAHQAYHHHHQHQQLPPQVVHTAGPNVFVSNVTANVNVHSFLPAQCFTQSFPAPGSAQPGPDSPADHRPPPVACLPTPYFYPVAARPPGHPAVFGVPGTPVFTPPVPIYRGPVPLPAPVPAAVATAVSTAISAAVPTAVPTAVPAAAPTAVPTVAPVPIAAQVPPPVIPVPVPSPVTLPAPVPVPDYSAPPVTHTHSESQKPREQTHPISHDRRENGSVPTEHAQISSNAATPAESKAVNESKDFMQNGNGDMAELKVKPTMNKLPPAFASRNAHHRQVSLPPEEPPPEPGLPKKMSYAQMAHGQSYAQMAHGQGQRAQADSAPGKPFAMIQPNVHHVSPRVQCDNAKVETPLAAEKPPAVSPGDVFKRGPETVRDHDINLQRLGEFLHGYNLDHTPEKLQPRGLTNRGNYCYVNAILQALASCPPFYNLMKAIPASQQSSKGGKSPTPIIDSMVKFVNEFSEMAVNVHPLGRKEKAQATKDKENGVGGGGAGGGAELTSAGPPFEPTYVYRTLGAMRAAFPVEGRQEDAEEFLSCLLNGLNDEMLEAMKLVKSASDGLNGESETSGVLSVNDRGETSDQGTEWTEVMAKNKSVVTRRMEFGRTPLSAIFQGQMRSRVIRAGVENSTTANVQPFFSLQLDVEKANSVEKALELLVGREPVSGGGGTCPKTNKEIPMFTQTSLEELPLILILHLKCFDYKLHTCSKILKTLEFPIDLKIDSKHLTSSSKTSTKGRHYKLLAVVYHDGKEATKGHYVTDVFHVGQSGWVRYDDASVRAVTQQQVLNPRSPRVPYLLYYRRCDTMVQQHDRHRQDR